MDYTDDFDYSDSVFLEIVEKETSIGFDNLNPYQQTVLSVWHSMGLIGNGGIKRFLLWEDADDNVVTAYQNIGCNDLSTAILECLKIFTEYQYPLSSEEREIIIESNYKKYAKKFDKINKEFWSKQDNIIKKTAAFIRKNSSYFLE